MQTSFLELDKSVKVLHFVLTELSDSKEREKLIEELREIFTKEKVSVLNKTLFRKSTGGILITDNQYVCYSDPKYNYTVTNLSIFLDL